MYLHSKVNRGKLINVASTDGNKINILRDKQLNYFQKNIDLIFSTWYINKVAKLMRQTNLLLEN